MTNYFHFIIREAMMIRLNRERLSMQVYTILKGMIADYRFNPGTRVNVEQIAKEVGVSRTPVWEAVHRLVQEGLLENIPNRGVFMSALSPKQAIELYTVRETLEALAARLAIQNIDEKTIQKMDERWYEITGCDPVTSPSRVVRGLLLGEGAVAIKNEI